MKTKTGKVLLVLMLSLIILFSVLQTKSSATNSDIMIIKQDNNNYIIYIGSLLNQNFDFAFADSKDEEDLNYINAGTDNQGNYIAYVNQDLNEKFFNSEETFLWVRTKDKQTIVDGEKITLNDAKTIEELNQNKNITKVIIIQSNEQEGKIKINGQEGKTYFYQFSTVNSSEDNTKLQTLVNNIINFDENTNIYQKLTTNNELNQTYNKLISNLNNESWVKAENLEITEPYGATENQQYILWLKDSDGNIDIQFLTAHERTVTTVTERAEVQEVLSALPYTYDETTILWISLGIVVIAIISVLIFKKTNKKTKED